MVQLCPSVATPKTPKMAKSKTPKKSSAVDTPAKLEVKTPKLAKNTPAMVALQTPKIKKGALVKEESTPKVAALQTPKTQKKNLSKAAAQTPKAAAQTPKAAAQTPQAAAQTPKAAAQTPKNGTVSAKKNKTKTPKLKMPTEDVEMESEEEEAPLAEPSSQKEAVNESDDADMSSEEEEIDVKPKSGKSSASKKENSKKVGEKFGLFVRGFNYNSSEKAVTQHFSQFGTVIRCALPRNAQKKNLNKGFGFIEFSSQAAVDKAVAAAHMLDSRTLDVKVNDTESAGKRKSEDSNQPGGDHKRQLSTFDNELFVARLSFSSSKDTIKEHFSQFGEVISVGLPIKPNTSENKGFAFVAFKEASSLQKAMADTNQEIDSAKIVIEPRKKAVAKEAFPKPSHPNELFVGGLDNSTQRHTLEQHFSKYGKVSNVTLPWNKLAGKNKGFGFVSFELASNLDSALEEDHEIDGKKIGVKAAGSKSDDSAVSKKAKAAPAAAKVEKENDEEDEAESEEDDDEAEGEDEEAEGEDEEAEGEDEEAEGDDEEAESDDEEAEGEDEVEGEDDEAEDSEDGEDDEDDE